MPTLVSPLPASSETEPGQPVDVAAFVDLLAEHDSRLRALARRLLDDEALVDDALQEAYLRAYRALPRFRGESAVGTWLHRIVHNTCMDELRRRRRRAERPLDERTAEMPTPDTGDFGAERADLAAGLAGLPDDQRVAVVLVDGYGMDYASTALALGVPAGTVASRVSRGRAVLRRALATTG